jgi:chemotaxis signal transduction protein
VNVNVAEVKPAPDLASRAATEHIRGLMPVADRMVVLLDIDRLIGHEMSAPGHAPDGEAASPAQAAA